MSRTVNRVLLAGLLACAAGALRIQVGRAGEPVAWMPEAPGYFWVFEDSLGVRDTLVSLGVQDFYGAACITLERTAGSRYPGRRTYYSNTGAGAAGALAFHGSWDPTLAVGQYHVPPIRVAVGGAGLHDAWADTVLQYHLPSNTPRWTIAVQTTVERTAAVPPFAGVAIGTRVELSFPAVFAPGERPGPGVLGSPNPLSWYAFGPGYVGSGPDAGYRLVDFGHPTQTVKSSWGRLKRMFR